MLSGEATSASANFTVDKNSSRIEVPEAFTLHRSLMSKPEAPPAAAAAPAAASTTVAAAPGLTRKLSKSPRDPVETASINRAPGPGLDGAPLNTLRVTLHPVGAGTYPSKVVLASGGDVRVLDVEFVAIKSGQQVTLEFNSPARDKLVQEVGQRWHHHCLLGGRLERSASAVHDHNSLPLPSAMHPARTHAIDPASHAVASLHRTNMGFAQAGANSNVSN